MRALSSEAAIKYFVLGALASGMLLYGMSMVYGATGTLDLAQIHASATWRPRRDTTLLLFGLVFMIVGHRLQARCRAVPHVDAGCLPGRADADDHCSSARRPKLAAFGMAYRLLEGAAWPALHSTGADAARAGGAVAGDRQSGRDRADQSQAHAGVFDNLAHGFPAARLRRRHAEGYAAAMFYAIGYALMATAAFGVILAAGAAGFEAEQIDDFKGLNQRNPWFACLMLHAMFSLAGVPPLFGFCAKLMVLKAAIDARHAVAGDRRRSSSRSSACTTTCA